MYALKKETLVASGGHSVPGPQMVCSMESALTEELRFRPARTPSASLSAEKQSCLVFFIFSLTASCPLGDRKNTNLGFVLFTF